MQNVAWRKALEAAADASRAQHHLERLQATAIGPRLRKASAEQARRLVALLSGSQALSEMLVAHPDWTLDLLNLEGLELPRRKEGLERDVQELLGSKAEPKDSGTLGALREFKQRQTLRIAMRDLARLGDAITLTQELSDLADVCLSAVFGFCKQRLGERLGQPFHQDAEGRWRPTGATLIGLGKLGGQELNYSSDVDVMLVYAEEGSTFRQPPGRAGSSSGRGLSNHQFFVRLAEAFIAEITRLTPEGVLFRIDFRLRPEGKAGPLARSLSSYENYYAQWGQTWERMMLIKARPVAGDLALAAEFLETIQPFRYPRSLNQRVLQEIAAMKDRIESEVVKAGEIERNVKLGRGGIREIEFVTQTLQLLHGGRNPFLQDTQTLPGLVKLARYELIPGADVEGLSRAYRWLRDVEHRLQMENNLQTHTIPTDRRARQRLSALMGCASLAEFERVHQAHTAEVRRTYDSLLKGDDGPRPRDLPDLASQAPAWLELLRERSFRNPEKASQLIREFTHGPGYVHVSPRTTELAMRLLPHLLDHCPTQALRQQGPAWPAPVLSDPDRVLARLDSYVSAYGARATLYELWTNNPALFELLLWVFDRSEFLAELAIRTPDLVDELEVSGRLRRSKSADETLRDLRYGRKDTDQRLWLRRYHQTELMRIGLRDILGLADFEQNLVELSALADACLGYALEVVCARHKLRKPPFVIIGLGKLGGEELNYGSDLDITFVAEPNAKNLPDLQGMAAEVMELLSSPTELGMAFPTDARLRPDGEKGLLVNTLTAYEEYYRRRAQLWEIQALSRTRAVAGHLELGERFQALAHGLTDFREARPDMTAYTPGWKQEIARMRIRIERERSPAGKGALAIKTGPGGLMDAEFAAQSLCLAHGWHEANTLNALRRAQAEKVLVEPDAELLIENYRKLRRVEAILRRWSYAGETVLPDDPAPLYRVAVRCGFTDSEHFMAAVGKYRAAIREVYTRIMAGPA